MFRYSKVPIVFENKGCLRYLFRNVNFDIMRYFLFFYLVAAPLLAYCQCEKIERKVDKFEGSITIRSPLLEAIGFTKVMTESDTMCFLSLDAVGYSAGNVNGADVLFEDGYVWHTDKKTDVRVNRSGPGFTHSVFEDISEEELTLFTEKIVTDIRVGVVERSIKARKAGKYLEWAKCLLWMQ
jgi:hypothetical protein